MVRAKFTVQAVTETKTFNRDGTEEKYGEYVQMHAAYAPDPSIPEDHAFWKATPNGQLNMQISNPAVFGKFPVGKSFYLDFTEAE